MQGGTCGKLMVRAYPSWQRKYHYDTQCVSAEQEHTLPDPFSVTRRPVDKGLAKRSKLPKVSKAWAVEGKLGGWDAVQDKFFAGQARRGGRWGKA